MPALTQPSKGALWTGRILSGLIVAFMGFDAIVKIIKIPAAVEGTAKLGYPPNVLVPIGLVALACVVLYVIPSTSVLGAILLTGYLGGADRLAAFAAADLSAPALLDQPRLAAGAPGLDAHRPGLVRTQGLAQLCHRHPDTGGDVAGRGTLTQ